MAKLYGPFHALNNPLVMADLGLHGLETLAHIYRDFKDDSSNEFAARASLTGQPVTELEGGPFRKFASKITGGLVSPNEKASTQDLLGEQEVLQNQEKTKLGNLATMLKIRDSLPIGTDMSSIMPVGLTGGGPFGGGGPGGISRIDWNAPSENQLHKAKLDEKLDLDILNADPDRKLQTALTLQRAKREDATSPKALAGIALKSRTAAEAAEPVKVRTAGEEARARLGVITSPEALAGEEARSRARTVGTGTGKNIVMENTPLSDMKDETVYDSNLKNLTAATPDVKYGDLPHGTVRVKTGSKQDLAIQAVPSAHEDLVQMRKLILDDKKGEIFPLAGNKYSLIARGKQNWGNRKANPKLNQFYSYMNDLIKNVRIANGGRVMSAELNMSGAFWPDPGTGRMSASRGILANLMDDTGLDAGPAETRMEALNKISKLDRQTVSIAKATASQGITEDDESTAEDAIDAATDDGSD